MEPTVAARLTAFTLTSIANGIVDVASTWDRLCVERLSTGGKTLATLNEQYRDLMEGLPDCGATQLEDLMRRYARAMRLKDDRITATQRKYLQDQTARNSRGSGSRLEFKVKPRGDVDEYLAPLYESLDEHSATISAGAVLYLASHRSLGTLFQTCTEAFRDRLCDPEVRGSLLDGTGCVTLGALIQAHARWLNELIAIRQATPLVLGPADSPDESGFDDNATTGSWLDDVADAVVEEDDAESEWVLASRRHPATASGPASRAQRQRRRL